MNEFLIYCAFKFDQLAILTTHTHLYLGEFGAKFENILEHESGA
jgi:hypothetical protein